MKINDFELEVFFEKYEFNAPYLLAQSDCESMTIGELLALEPGAKEDFLSQRLSYTEVSGNPELRQLIANLYTTMTPENIIVHAGAQEVIFNYMNVLLDAGDHIICQFPTYQSLFEVADAIGAETSRWLIESGENRWEMDLKKLEALIRPNTKLIVLNSPNNPTGFTFTKEEIDEIVLIARKHDLYVFCDEVYMDVDLDRVKRPRLVDCYEKGVSLGVMSKAYGLAGLRIGWIATHDQELAKRLIKMKHYTTICSSGPSEFLAMVALKHGEEILQRNIAIIQNNIKYAEQFFSRFPNLFEFIPPMAGPIAFVKVNIDKPIIEYCESLVAESGVLLLPGSVYGVDGPYVRIGFGRADFIENLKKYEDYLIEKERSR